MVERTGDPYTIWIPPRDRNEFVKEVQGTFAGIGVSVAPDPQGALVKTPLDESPALRAGIQAGDLIVAVGPEPLAGMALADIIALVSGPEGSPVEITIRRDDQHQVFNVVRRKIKPKRCSDFEEPTANGSGNLRKGSWWFGLISSSTRPQVIFDRC